MVLASDHFHGHIPPHTRQANSSVKRDPSTMAKNYRPVIVPTRRSSVNAATTDDRFPRASPPSTTTMDAKLGFYDHGPKAQQILGTGMGIGTEGIRFQHDWNELHEKKQGGRKSDFVGKSSVDVKPSSRKGSTAATRYTPFSTIREEPEGVVPMPMPPPPPPLPPSSASPSHIRLRASSPLLGKFDPSYDAQPSSAPDEVHRKPSSSSAALYPRGIPKTPPSRPPPHPPSSSSSRSHNSSTRKLDAEQHTTTLPKEARNPMPESDMRKVRPRKIDLSLLFPKPRAAEVPLLSPQRMTDSPSPISAASEHFGHARSKTPPGGPDGIDHQKQVHEESVPPLPSGFEEEDPNSVDASVEKVVRSNDIDRALQQFFRQKRLSQTSDKTLQAAAPGRPGVPYRNREQSRKNSDSTLTKESVTARRGSTRGSVNGRSKDTETSPNSRFPNTHRMLDSVETRYSDPHSRFPVDSDETPISRKSSKITLKNADLQNSSVLCLSSSSEDEGDEDEDEGECEEPQIQRFDEDGRTTERMLTAYNRLEKPSPIGQYGWGEDQISRLFPRPPSMSSRGSSSTAKQKTRPRESSSKPTVSQSETMPAQKPSRQSSKFPTPSKTDRRSRVMAVTREEENLLAAMRDRRGKITPSLFRETRHKPINADPEKESMLSVSTTQRDSFYGGDTSFLRLSTSIPSRPGRSGTDRGTSHLPDRNRTSTFSQNTIPSTSSDAEQKTIYSDTDASCRLSLAFSEGLPSSSTTTTTSGSSPSTPVLPIYRFSPLPSRKSPPSQQPPQQPLPAAPPSGRRDSRRRPDSRDALILDDTEDAEKEEFPIWAYGWCNDAVNLPRVSTVH